MRSKTMFHTLLFNVASGTNYAGNGRSVGVYRIATYLRENNWDVEVIDFAPEWTLQELKNLTCSRLNPNTKFFGFSHMFSIWPDVMESFCKWLKECYPDLLLISGSGVSPQFKSDYIDYYIQGFGEKALVKLLKWLFSNGSKPIFSTHKTNNRHLISANDSYHSYPMKSLMIKYEDRDFLEPHEWLGVEFSRGCKFACDFCNFPVLGVKGDYSRDADDFAYQMKDTYDRFGVTNYLVADETFNDRTEKITKFANVVEKLDFQPWFSGFIRPDLIVSRKQDREELLRMGFLGHHYGVESFNHKAVKSIGKGMDPEKLKHGILDVKKYFENNGSKRYRTLLTFIIGLPGEDAASWDSTTKWLTDNWQGQAFTPFVLEIPLGELNRKSKMSMDYAKYGYRKYIGDKKEIAIQQARVSDELLIWENDFLNYFQAYDIFEKMIQVKNNYKNNFTLAPWDLAMVGLPRQIDEKLQLHNTYTKNKDVDEIRYQFVERYKRKKLSYA